MSDPSANQAPVFDLTGNQPAPPTQPAAPEPSAPAEVQLSEYAQELLKTVPDADRAVVERYINQWDAGVSRRVAPLQAMYEPISSILDQGYELEDLQVAAQMYDWINKDPQSAVRTIAKQFGITVQEAAEQAQAVQQQVQQALPPEVTGTLTKMEQFMEQFAMQQQAVQQTAQEAAQEQELDTYLSLLRQEKGDFDEMFVLSRMNIGVPGDVAVDEFNQMISTRTQSAAQPSALPAVPVLNGGSAAVGPQNIATASDKDRRALVASMLHAAANA